jgi:hypothetical protein
MADIINLSDDAFNEPERDSQADHLNFLNDEGLKLLAAYRLIEDRAIRASVMELVVTLAAKAANRLDRD